MFLYVLVSVSETKKHATKNDTYRSNLQPLNSDLLPFVEKGSCTCSLFVVVAAFWALHAGEPFDCSVFDRAGHLVCSRRVSYFSALHIVRGGAMLAHMRTN